MINMQCILKDNYNDFPSGPVAVKDLLSNARDAGLFLCQRTKILHATEQLGLHVSNSLHTASTPRIKSPYHKKDPSCHTKTQRVQEMINKYTI